MEAMVEPLPPVSSLSPSVLAFLNARLDSTDDLRRASSLASELRTQCVDLDQSLLDLNRRLGTSLIAFASFSDRAGELFGDINGRLANLHSLSDGGRGEGSGRSEQILGEELPSLAKEVARVETVRMYAGEFYCYCFALL